MRQHVALEKRPVFLVRHHPLIAREIKLLTEISLRYSSSPSSLVAEFSSFPQPGRWFHGTTNSPSHFSFHCLTFLHISATKLARTHHILFHRRRTFRTHCGIPTTTSSFTPTCAARRASSLSWRAASTAHCVGHALRALTTIAYGLTTVSGEETTSTT